MSNEQDKAKTMKTTIIKTVEVREEQITCDDCGAPANVACEFCGCDLCGKCRSTLDYYGRRHGCATCKFCEDLQEFFRLFISEGELRN